MAYSVEQGVPGCNGFAVVANNGQDVIACCASYAEAQDFIEDLQEEAPEIDATLKDIPVNIEDNTRTTSRVWGGFFDPRP